MTRIRPAAAVLALLLAGPPGAAAQPLRPECLAGEMILGGATLVDPPPGEAPATHAYLTLTGAAARRLFAAMPGRASPDACEPGRRRKAAGPLVCSIGRARTEARCGFAIDLGRGILAAGQPC